MKRKTSLHVSRSNWYRQTTETAPVMTANIDPKPTPEESPPDSIYRSAFPAGVWEQLPMPVRLAHQPGVRHVGTLRVTRSERWFLRFLATLMRLPKPGDAVVELQIQRVQTKELEERWHRSFDGLPLVSAQSIAPDGCLTERIHLLEFRFRLLAEPQGIRFQQISSILCLGPLRIPLPTLLAPRIEASEMLQAEASLTSVSIALPFLGTFITYEGSLAVKS